MITNEVITTLNLIRNGEYESLDYKRIQVACNVAIEALSKQTPRKPLDIERCYDGDYGFCPNCKKVVNDYQEFQRCHKCGQKLDWR